MLEVDFELVALDCGNDAVAELAVEHALAEREVGTALIAERHRRTAGFNDARGFSVVRGSGRALPAGPPAWPRDMSERVGTFRPLSTPQTLAAGHRRFFLNMVLGEFGQETRRNAAGPLAVDPAVGGVEDG